MCITLGIFRATKPKADTGTLYVYKSLCVNTQSKHRILVPALSVTLNTFHTRRQP